MSKFWPEDDINYQKLSASSVPLALPFEPLIRPNKAPGKERIALAMRALAVVVMVIAHSGPRNRSP